MFDAQTLITAVVVAACAVYAGWQLLPAGLQRRVQAALGRGAPAPSIGCAGGCGGCPAAAGAKPAGRTQVIQVVRRPKLG